MSRLTFEPIIGNEKQKETLYELLSLRRENISHSEMPDYGEHSKFVDTHPYRIWYLINKDLVPIGSFYIKYDNSIGLNIVECSEFVVDNIIKFIKDHWVPEAPVESMVPPFFYVNVAAKNTKLITCLRAIGAKELQIAYKLG